MDAFDAELFENHGVEYISLKKLVELLETYLEISQEKLQEGDADEELVALISVLWNALTYLKAFDVCLVSIQSIRDNLESINYHIEKRKGALIH